MVTFDPARGSEQRGLRPALVVQNDVGNEYAATTIVAAISTTIKVYPVTVPLARGEGGLRQGEQNQHEEKSRGESLGRRHEHLPVRGP